MDKNCRYPNCNSSEEEHEGLFCPFYGDVYECALCGQGLTRKEDGSWKISTMEEIAQAAAERVISEGKDFDEAREACLKAVLCLSKEGLDLRCLVASSLDKAKEGKENSPKK